MRISTHESFARRIVAQCAGRLPASSFLQGATAPNKDRRLPNPHHCNPKARKVIGKYVRLARKRFLSQHYDDAAYALGVASHYVLDNLVPVPTGHHEHGDLEKRYENAERHLDYPDDLERELAGGRAVEEYVAQAGRLRRVSGSDLDRKLSSAYLKFLRLAHAVTASPEPLSILEPLAQAHGRYAARLKQTVQHYRDELKQVLARELFETGTAGRGRGSLLASAMGECNLLRQEGAAPGLLTAALGALGTFALRRKARAALAGALGPEQHGRAAKRRCRELATNYREAVDGLRKRYDQPDWFRIRWDFWYKKGRQTYKEAVGALTKVRNRAIQAATDPLQQQSAARALYDWPGTRRARLLRWLDAGAARRLLFLLAPILLLAAAAGGLVLAGKLSRSSAAIISLAGAAVVVLIQRRFLITARTLSRLSAQEAPAQQPQSAPEPGRDASTT